MTADRDKRDHWDAAYAGGDEGSSWTQRCPERSLAHIETVCPDPSAPILDVGGGASRLAGQLLRTGYRDVTVLDVSPAALELARGRLGESERLIEWIVADILDWEPPRAFAVWHDRALLHFLTDGRDRARYASILRAALRPGGHAVIATFAADGPDRCSGLPVRRSSAEEILDLLGAGFELVTSEVEEHRTPSGRVQPFTWAVARRECDERKPLGSERTAGDSRPDPGSRRDPGGR